MIFLFILGICIMVLIFVSSHEQRWIRHGRLVCQKHLVVNTHRYYIEEVKFETYQEALSKFYAVVDDVANHAEVKEVSYDLYDWMFTIFRFENYTIELRNLRRYNKIQMIKSTVPLSIKDYENDNIKR